MGMGFTFVTSPDKLESPPPAARSCLENSLVPGAETENSAAKSSSMDHKFKSAVAAVAVLGGLSLLG